MAAGPLRYKALKLDIALVVGAHKQYHKRSWRPFNIRVRWRLPQGIITFVINLMVDGCIVEGTHLLASGYVSATKWHFQLPGL